MRTALVWIAISMALVLGLGLACWADCSCVGDDCYEDVIVSGAGSPEANGTYTLHSIQNVGGQPPRPRFDKSASAFVLWWDSGAWQLLDSPQRIYYSCTSTAVTPPSTGWFTVTAGLAPGVVPPPVLSGGEECLPPSILGTPQDANACEEYTFLPTVENGHAPLAYSVTNLPTWARFDATTGEIYGTPESRDSGEYTAVEITVEDVHGRSDTLGPFTITVEADGCPSTLQVTPLGADGGFLEREPGYDPWKPVARTFRIEGLDGDSICGFPLHVFIFEVDASTDPSTRQLIDYNVYHCDPSSGEYTYTVPVCTISDERYEVAFVFSAAPYIPMESLPLMGQAPTAGEASNSLLFDGVYTVGETVTGRCMIRDSGTLCTTSYIHAYFNALDTSTRPTVATLLDHWVIRCSDQPGLYSFEIATEELSPGDYLIRLVFEDGSTEDLTIQLVAPPT